jgi:hypothetical protein
MCAKPLLGMDFESSDLNYQFHDRQVYMMPRNMLSPLKASFSFLQKAREFKCSELDKQVMIASFYDALSMLRSLKSSLSVVQSD